MKLKPKDITLLQIILWQLGHDPRPANDGWRSRDPLVVASLFAARGYPVFPCTSFKTPLIKNGVHGATCDLKTIYYWDRDKPLAGWCVKTGRFENNGPPGLWIFDKDDAAGYARWAELVSELGPPPPTWTLLSGREGGGEHVYYAPTAEGPDMKTVPKAMINGKRGKIDQKGRGGYAVIAGSLHKSGNRYHWKPGHAPDELPLALLPPTWVEAMDKADERSAPTGRVRLSRPFRPKRNHDPSSLMIGDGMGYGGFNAPIYKNAINYFFKAGADAPAEPIVETLIELINEAPKDHGRDVSRYLAGPDLPRLVERARAYVTKVKEEERVGYELREPIA